MADYFRPKYDDEQEQLYGSATGGGGGSPYAALTSLVGGTAAPQRQQGSGQYQDFGRLLEANKGAGAEMARRISGAASSAISQASSRLTGATDTFNRGVQGATAAIPQLPTATRTVTYTPPVTLAPGVLPTALPGGKVPSIPSFPGVRTLGKTAVTAPAPVTVTRQVGPTIGQIDQMQTAAYNGPTSVTQTPGFVPATEAYVRAMNTLGGLNSFSGLQAALTPGASSSGGARFDSLLAGREGGAGLRDAALRGRELAGQYNQALDRGTAGVSEGIAAAGRASDIGKQLQAALAAGDLREYRRLLELYRGAK